MSVGRVGGIGVRRASPSHRTPLVVKDDTAQHLWENLTQAMGLDPFGVLDCFSDLGLSDTEIARYFHISPAEVGWLRSRPRAGIRAQDAPPH